MWDWGPWQDVEVLRDGQVAVRTGEEIGVGIGKIVGFGGNTWEGLGQGRA